MTVIIPARPDQAEIKAAAAARQLDYPADRLEIMVARGKQPSIQRNAALRAAGGDLIYFLDDDSVPLPGNLRQAVRHFADRSVQMAGGPNLCPPDAPLIEQVFAVVLASWLAFGPSRARYLPTGSLRQSGEKELILCNLVARRDGLLELGGFNEALYPNEENALMDEIRKRGGKLIYDPQLVVYRRPRRTLKSFARMLMTYGRGRAEQFRLHPTTGSALNFVPPLFCLYLAALPFFAIRHSRLLHGILFWPLLAYGLAVLGQTAFSARRHGLARSIAALPLLAASHILYGLGVWRGLFTPLKTAQSGSAPPPVTLETLKR